MLLRMCGVLISGLEKHFSKLAFGEEIPSIWIKYQSIFLLLIILLILVTFSLDEVRSWVQTLLVWGKNGTLRVNHSFQGVHAFMSPRSNGNLEELVLEEKKNHGVPAVKSSWNKSDNQQQTKLNPHKNSPHGQTGGKRTNGQVWPSQCLRLDNL